MVGKELYAAHAPEPHRLLGVDLRPFSLGHLILLHRLDNAFVTGTGTGVQIPDLVTAVFICSQTFEESVSAITTGRVPCAMRGAFGLRRVRSLPLDEAMRQWQQAIGPFDLAEKCQAFRAYMEAGSQHPMIATVRGESIGNPMPSGCPFVQMVKVTLMARLHFTEAEVLNYPWALALWNFCTLKVMDGQLRIVEGDDIESARTLADALQRRYDTGELKLPA